MGVYEVLFDFLDASGSYLGEPGTFPWAQGFPLTTQIPGGPPIPGSVEFGSADLKYPSATGLTPLLEALRDYFNNHYDADITVDNIAVFAGGRPAIFATICHLDPAIPILIEETEYTPYWDLLQLFDREVLVVPSNSDNMFRPTVNDYEAMSSPSGDRRFVIKSNPCNPTGVTWSGDALRQLVDFCSRPGHGGIIDEAYEFFYSPQPVSALTYIDDIDSTEIFVVGAATKGLQVPGMRTGWVVASKKNIETFRNHSSIAMGGVARPSQIYVTKLLEPGRVELARRAIGEFYCEQRSRYGAALSDLGVELFTGDGGFYHWGRLPGNLTARQLNERLYRHQAAILPGTLCDMKRRGEAGPHSQLIRFSFGPIDPSTFEENIRILASCLSESPD